MWGFCAESWQVDLHTNLEMNCLTAVPKDPNTSEACLSHHANVRPALKEHMLFWSPVLVREEARLSRLRKAPRMNQTTQTQFHKKRLREYGTFSLRRSKPREMTSLCIYSGDREDLRIKLKSNTGTRTEMYKLAINKYIMGIKIAFLTISRLKFWNCHPSRKEAGTTKLMEFIFFRRYTAACHRTQEILCSPEFLTWSRQIQ